MMPPVSLEHANFEMRLLRLPAHFREHARRMPENVALVYDESTAIEEAAALGQVPLAVIADRLLKPDPAIMSGDRGAHVVGALVASALRPLGHLPTDQVGTTGAAWPKTGAMFTFIGNGSMFWTPTEVFRGLAGASRKHNWPWLMEQWFDVVRGRASEELPEVVILGDGHEVPTAALDELFSWSRPDNPDVSVISPAGARFLVALYEGGVLEVKGKRRAVSESLRQYCESEPGFLSRRRAEIDDQRRRADADKQHQERLRDLASFTEADFTPSLLEQIFLANRGLGEGELIIGGIPVSKCLRRFASNSGKSNSWTVTFEWRDADGVLQKRDLPSRYEGNRRNDADRNWGLPG